MIESIFDIPAGDLYALLVDTFDEKVRVIARVIYQFCYVPISPFSSE